MVRRGDDEPPERDRRGGLRRTNIGDARAFTPRGRTTRDGVGRDGAGRDGAGRDGADHESARRDGAGRGTADRDIAGAREPARRARPTAGAQSAGAQSAGAQSAGAQRREADRRKRAPLRMVRGGRPARAAAVVPPRQRRPAADRGRPTEPQRQPAAVAAPRLGEPKRRLRLATALSLLLFAAIGIRLVQLQLTDATAYAEVGLKERLVPLVLPAARGTIYDRTGAMLAHSVEGRYVAVDPEMVVDPKQTALLLAPLLGKAPSELEPLLQKKKAELSGKAVRFRWLYRGLSVQTGEQVSALKLKGIIVERDERRNLPGNDLAANLIGFTGIDMNGLAGIEARYDDLLRGHNGLLQYEAGQGELRAPIPGGYQSLTPAQPGTSLTLTIDRDVQFFAQRVLFEQMSKVKATFGAAVVMKARTGEIIAEASYPSYNAADPEASKPADRGDAATGVVVDPGSVHKAIVLAAALQEKVITPDSTIEIGPTIKKGDQVFRDSHQLAQGTRITLPGVMAWSSNVATIKIASELGAQKLYDYQRLFGLGEKTGIGVPGESAGLIQPPANWSPSSYGSVPIGHSVSVTPLQMAAAYNVIANNGVYVAPRLVKESIAADGTVTPMPVSKSHRVISAENAASLRTIMEAVITADQATGHRAAVDGYRVAGKTGTGLQVKNGKYIDGEVASFIGMAPAENPEYVIAVFAHTPKEGSGGLVAGPAFSQIMGFTLRHFTVLPTTSRSPKFVLHY